MSTDHAVPGARGRAVVALLAIALVVSGCGGQEGSPGAEEGSLVGERVLAAGGSAYDDVRLTWAQGSTLHYGRESFDVGVPSIRSLVATSSGWFVEAARNPSLDAATHWEFFDGREGHRLGDEVSFVSASPDGRYAGWIDRDGPTRPGGQVARAVVVDLATGRVVLDDSSGMGGQDDDGDVSDLYSELPPTFLGFDDTFAYWQTPDDGRVRWSAATGVEPAQKEVDGAPGPVAIGRPSDRYAGASVSLVDGRPDTSGTGGATGSLSPDEDTAAETGSLGRAPVTDARTGRRLPLAVGHRFRAFGSWVGDDEVVLLATDERLEGVDVSGVDPSRGFLTTCSLSGGRCQDVAAIDGTFSVVFPAQGRDFLL